MIRSVADSFPGAAERATKRHGLPPDQILFLVGPGDRERPVRIRTMPLSEALEILPARRTRHIQKPMRDGVLRVFAWLPDGFSVCRFVYPDGFDDGEGIDD